MTAAAPLAPSPRAVLRACGWLAADASLVRLSDLSSSHSVHLAERADGARAVVKQARANGKRGLGPELFVYRMAGWTPELAEIVARPLHIDEGVQVLAMEALPEPGRGFNRRDPALFRAMGGVLARVHRATLGAAMLPSPAMGILAVPDQLEVTSRDRAESTRAYFARIASHTVLAPALRRAAADYHCRCLVHGDIRPDHWVELGDGSLRLIDWEMSGGGDPALDFAAAMVEPGLDALRSGEFDRDWIESAAPLLRALVSGYAGADGPLELTDPAMRSHAVRLGAARLLHVGSEWAENEASEIAVNGVYAQAVAMASQPGRIEQLIAP